ncbi:MAG: hypothetical protein O7E52_17055, partial [Candidatus Poribacteria bacterium]|nr:hypothetical protein [Candidatus Poribacteria bacterium]
MEIGIEKHITIKGNCDRFFLSYQVHSMSDDSAFPPVKRSLPFKGKCGIFSSNCSGQEDSLHRLVFTAGSPPLGL